MKRFYAERLLRIAKISDGLNQMCLQGLSSVEVSEVFRGGVMESDTRQFMQDCHDLGLGVSELEAKRFLLGIKSNLTGDELADLIHCLLKVLESELSANYFVCIRSDHRDLMLPGQHFSEAVGRVFPDASHDISEASVCLALERYQACVFHSMLILEHGLKWMYGELAIPFPPFEQWHKLIGDIEGAIKSLNIPKTDVKGRERREFLAGAASHFRLVKDGWRNHVSHGRGTNYGPEATEAIYRSVRQFMIELAEYAER